MRNNLQQGFLLYTTFTVEYIDKDYVNSYVNNFLTVTTLTSS